MEIITVRKSINIYWHASTHICTYIHTCSSASMVYVHIYVHFSVELSTAISEFTRKVHDNSNSLVPLNNNNATRFDMLYSCCHKSFHFFPRDIACVGRCVCHTYKFRSQKLLNVTHEWEKIYWKLQLISVTNHFPW